jgi:hypothetical protein
MSEEQASREDGADPTGPSRSSAYFSSSINEFHSCSEAEIYARLTHAYGFALRPEQLASWKYQIPLLRRALAAVPGWINLEFDIPRIGKRADVVITSGPAVIVVEFKVGAKSFNRNDIDQAWDYGLDLKNFHEHSHSAPIFPILCATNAPKDTARWRPPHADGVYPPLCCNAKGLNAAIARAIGAVSGTPIDGTLWGMGRYSPTPTIIEAARALYSRHTVHDIVRHGAGATNMSNTTGKVEHIIADTRERKRKAIIFVTGVPGAGKTLVGLNVATRHGKSDASTHATYLSGNGPLVSVLREALARDEHARRVGRGEKVRIGECRSAVASFIHRVHHFRDETLRDSSPPNDRIVVFDEAQRAWHSVMLANFMRRKRAVPGFSKSEPEVLIGAMDRHDDWAVVLCLVGGGQEINTGEAGISEWLDAIRTTFPHWDVHLSSKMSETEFGASNSIDALKSCNNGSSRVIVEDSLHLATSIRSFRTEHLSSFVRAVLEGDAETSRSLHEKFEATYPVVVTRSMKAARSWIRANRRGSQRAGLVASSSAQRLKPHAVDIRVNVDPVHWFLDDARDTRSSQYLEDAATEFQVQGLEVDWAIVAWDADLRRENDHWTYHSFRGAGWTNVKKHERRRYLLNAYRVLLTRARQGMVIFVPPGRRRDRTRSPAYYQGIYDYLLSVGVKPLPV